MLGSIQKIADRLQGLSAFVAALALIVITVTVLIDVVGRYFGHPLYGSRDIVQMAAVVVAFGGLGYAELRGGHISVDVLESRFSPRMNRWLVTAGLVAGAVFFAVLAVMLWKEASVWRMLHRSTNILFIPRAPFGIAASVACGIAALCFTARGLNRMFGAANGA